jgi:hypothetical protein
MENFEPIYSSVIPNYFLESYIDIKRNLLLHQPWYYIKENKWTISCMSNEAEKLNNFYTQFPSEIVGTIDECIEKVKDYK